MLRSISFLLLIACRVCCAAPDPTSPMVTAAQSSWFEDAKFGMFVHFGLYSIPAGVWDDRPVGRNGYAEWIRYQHGWPQSGGIDADRYNALVKDFNPVDFDADVWIEEAKRAGMRYFLITAKHHDGFALWDSQVCDFNVVDASPFGRDILRELADACRKNGIRLGFYYSHWQDWHHPGGGRPPWPEIPEDPAIEQPSDAEFQRYWDEKCLPQVKELLVGYEPDFFWFDSWGRQRPPFQAMLTKPRLQSLIRTVRELRPQCLINSRIGTDDGVDFLSMSDNYFPPQGFDRPWETSGTLNHSWGYHRLDYHWKPTSQLIRWLVDNASRGGNYQLNVGPTAAGVFQAPAIRRLREIGAWMDINGEAIHGTRRAPFDEPEWGRMTWREGKESGSSILYLLIYDQPESSDLRVHLPGMKPVQARMIETDEILACTKLADRADWVSIRLPQHLPDERVSVVALELESDPTLR